MKYIKTYEYKDHDKELVRLMWKKLNGYNTEINGFDIDCEHGTISWHGKDYGFYATPYWEYSDDLQIEIYDQNGDTFEEISVELNVLKNISDVDKEVDKYYKIIYDITEKLNKRSEIVEMLKKIYDHLPTLIKNYIEYESEEFTNIKTDDLIHIYSIIEQKYPELITSHKYNI
jgi:hypothetical protein